MKIFEFVYKGKTRHQTSYDLMAFGRPVGNLGFVEKTIDGKRVIFRFNGVFFSSPDACADWLNEHAAIIFLTSIQGRTADLAINLMKALRSPGDHIGNVSLKDNEIPYFSHLGWRFTARDGYSGSIKSGNKPD